MSRPFAFVMLALSCTTAFLIGLIVTGWAVPAPALSESQAPAAMARRPAPENPTTNIDPGVAARVTRQAGGLVNFADVAERINPAVVNIEATTRGTDRRRRIQPDNVPFDDAPAAPGIPVVRPQSGTGFVIEGNGVILTNYHVIQGAERIMVKFADGRNLVAHPLGVDPDTDIALIKVEGVAGTNFPVAPLGNSDSLRVGEWVCAIGNPLAYEHTVTVGVVSYLGRKLFDSSLDNYIQTDAAINFGNSGGPLINGNGEVVGINAAISQRASNIGFAVPINEATAILPQLKADGHVSRGFMGVTLTDVDPDLQASLNLGTQHGALVQDVTPGSPGQRAGLHVYDLITAIDGRRVATNDEIIREIARRVPGTIAQLQVRRDGQPQVLSIRLGERPNREVAEASDPTGHAILQAANGSPLGMNVRDIDRDATRRLHLPDGITGALVTRVEALSAAWDAGIQRDYVVLEINRRPVESADAYNRLARAARPGEVLAVYVYVPGLDQRAIRAVRVEGHAGVTPH
jgi:serine protease Do